ncbi:MAG: diadenylate cyclase CdaA [Paludibacteraceae bacterium]|nr:diadenylate cyclase CdaA [Paludibacteraceae bacterium]MBR4813871.1 diadenylate cyclase CdaA [Paludibacteraceae bacterium]
MIRLIDYIDIILVTCILYKTYKVLRGTVAIRVFIGILFFVVAWLVVNFLFQMQLLGGIMNQIVNVGAIALIVLFQDEIRQTLSRIGTGHDKVSSFINRLFSANPSQLVDAEVMQIIIACKNMAKRRVGALIVFEKTKDLKNIEVTGDFINAEINARLIENIFFKNSPLHDGAMIISKNKITAAGCILPVSHNFDLPKEIGLRHRAAVGLSEKTDALVIIVSEETGRISCAQNGSLKINISPEDLEAILTNKFEEDYDNSK